MTDVERVRVEFEAQVASAIRDIYALRDAINSVGNQRATITITDRGSAQRTQRQAGQAARGIQGSNQRAARSTGDSWQITWRGIDEDYRRRMGRMPDAAGRAGRDSANRFHSHWARAWRGHPDFIQDFLSGTRLTMKNLSWLAPGVTGLMAPLVGAFQLLLPTLAGVGLLAPLVAQSFGKVTKTAKTLKDETEKYNDAASQTAENFRTNAKAARDWAVDLADMTPQQQAAGKLLDEQGHSWMELTKAQRAGMVQLRQDKEAWKDLTKSQQDSVTAMLKQRDALRGLPPEQRKALIGYQEMTAQWGLLRREAEPGLFLAMAAGERAMTSAMRPLLPVLDATSSGFEQLFTDMDGWFNSDEYDAFVDMWSSHQRDIIVGVGRALGNVGLWIVRLWMAWEPMIDPSLDWLERSSRALANWPRSPEGMKDLQHWLIDVRVQGPLVWGTLWQISKGIGSVIDALAGNPLAWQILKNMSTIFAWIASAPGGKVAINILAWAVAIKAVGKSLQFLAAYVGILGLLRRFGGTAAASTAGAGAAAGAAGGAAAGGAAAGGAARGAAAGAAGGAAAARSGAAATAGRAALTNPVTAVAGLLAGIVVADRALRQHTEKLGQRWRELWGVIKTDGGRLEAGASSHGVKMSKEFKDVANRYAAGDRTMHQVNEQGTHQMGADAIVLTQAGHKVQTANQRVIDAVYLGKTKFGQAAGVFVDRFGGDIAKMGGALRRQGKSLDEKFNSTMSEVFRNMGGKSEKSWKDFDREFAKSIGDHFQKQKRTTKRDVEDLNKAVTRFTDDAYAHRTDREKENTRKLKRALNRFMEDMNNGLIDTSDKRIGKLGRKINSYFENMTNGNAKAAARDLKDLGKMTSGEFSTMADKLGTNAIATFAKAVRRASGSITDVMKNFKGKLGGFATGGRVSGPGTTTSDSILARLSDSEHVWTAKEVEGAGGHAEVERLRAMARQGMPGFANGGFVGQAGTHARSVEVAWHAAAAGLAQKMRDKQEEAMQSVGPLPGVGGTKRWAGVVQQALRLTGQPLAHTGITLRRMNQESGGNPRAVNMWDINAKLGHPSVGLMQVIRPTFQAHAGPYRNVGPFLYGTSINPLANVYASMRYALSRYGSLPSAYNRAGGYDAGGIARNAGLMPKFTNEPERVLSPRQTQAFERLVALLEAGGLGGAGGQFVGQLVLDSGELLGTIRGTVQPMITASEERQAYRAKSGRR